MEKVIRNYMEMQADNVVRTYVDIYDLEKAIDFKQGTFTGDAYKCLLLGVKNSTI